MKIRIGISLGLLLCAAGAHAQLYKWVGPDGKVTYSDTPPPQTAKQVETKAVETNGVASDGLPYALAQTTKTHPVVLYTTSDCVPCDDGRRLLSQRGIPFAEKTVRTAQDAELFRKAAGKEAQLPFLLVGRSKHEGYAAATWNQSLTAAGYPETNALPRSYRNPPAQPAAPVAADNARAAPVPAAASSPSSAAETPRVELPPPPTGNAPPGFRF